MKRFYLYTYTKVQQTPFYRSLSYLISEAQGYLHVYPQVIYIHNLLEMKTIWFGYYKQRSDNIIERIISYSFLIRKNFFHPTSNKNLNFLQGTQPKNQVEWEGGHKSTLKNAHNYFPLSKLYSTPLKINLFSKAVLEESFRLIELQRSVFCVHGKTWHGFRELLMHKRQ